MTNLEPWQEDGNKKTNLSVVDILFHAKCVHLVTRRCQHFLYCRLQIKLTSIYFIPPQLQYGFWFSFLRSQGYECKIYLILRFISTHPFVIFSLSCLETKLFQYQCSDILFFFNLKCKLQVISFKS